MKKYIQNGKYINASIRSYGDCIHSFINDEDYQTWAPGFEMSKSIKESNNTQLLLIDHIVANVELDITTVDLLIYIAPPDTLPNALLLFLSTLSKVIETSNKYIEAP